MPVFPVLSDQWADVFDVVQSEIKDPPEMKTVAE